MPRAGGEDEAEKTAPKPGEKQVEIAGVAVAAKGRESQGWMGGVAKRRQFQYPSRLYDCVTVE